MAAKKATNPFYVVLMIAGTAFALTACAYGVMTVKMLDPVEVAESDETSRFFVKFMDEHGVTVMLVELGLLAVCTVAAISTDGFWTRDRKSRDGRSKHENSPSAENQAAKPKDAARSSS